jgi:hypothetical protein
LTQKGKKEQLSKLHREGVGKGSEEGGRQREKEERRLEEKKGQERRGEEGGERDSKGKIRLKSEL